MRDAAEQVLDAVVDLAQWFFDGAMAGEVAGSVNGDATGDEERAVDGADDLKGGDLRGRTGERVAAVGAGVGDEQAGLGQGLENLGEQGRRDVVGLGDVLGALARRCGSVLLGEVLERHEPVIRFFGQTQHCRQTLPGVAGAARKPTLPVLVSVVRREAGAQPGF